MEKQLLVWQWPITRLCNDLWKEYPNWKVQFSYQFPVLRTTSIGKMKFIKYLTPLLFAFIYFLLFYQ